MKQSSVPKKQFACSPPRVEEQRGNMGRETDFLHEYLFYLFPHRNQDIHD
jgi:hypothetical protein